MGMAWTKGLVAAMAVAWMSGVQPVHAQGASQGSQSKAAAYMSQRFTFQGLRPDVQASITQANLAPATFSKIVLHTRDTVTSPDRPKPSMLASDITFVPADHGLVRRTEVLRDDSGNAVAVRMELGYRGYFSLVSQTIPVHGDDLPPVQEVRKLLRFDTGTDGHFAMVYLYGYSDGPTLHDPGQFLCDGGKRYDASQINPSIEGQALEIQCRVIDANGMENDQVTLAYLEKYRIAVTLRTHNPQRTVDSAIVDFSAH